jgi:hypothetical protein
VVVLSWKLLGSFYFCLKDCKVVTFFCLMFVCCLIFILFFYMLLLKYYLFACGIFLIGKLK